jgi:hypothetical protein
MVENACKHVFTVKKKTPQTRKTALRVSYKGYFPPEIDIQTRISGVPHINQNFTLISNLHTVFYLVAYF